MLDNQPRRSGVSLEPVLCRLGHLDQLHGSGHQRRGLCPVHDPPETSHRSFSLHLAEGEFRCLHPPCQAKANPLDLWAAVHLRPSPEAAVQLAETFEFDSQIHPSATGSLANFGQGFVQDAVRQIHSVFAERIENRPGR